MGLFASPPPNHQSPVPLHPLEGVEGDVLVSFEGEVVVGFEGEVVVGFEGNGERGRGGYGEGRRTRCHNHFIMSYHGYVIIKVLKVMGGDGEH